MVTFPWLPARLVGPRVLTILDYSIQRPTRTGRGQAVAVGLASAEIQVVGRGALVVRIEEYPVVGR